MRDAVIKIVFGVQRSDATDRTSTLLLAACALLLAWKAWVITRLNVNWDEFYFLAHVHALLRGDLDIPYQTTYTQLFRWLPWVGDTELPQIYAGRWIMLALLAVATVQLIRLASRWVSPAVALVTAAAFLCASPLQRHGASFRSDSMLLPVLLGVLLLLTRAGHSRRTDICAGVLCGIGIALNVKFTLFAPLLMVCVLLAEQGAAGRAARAQAMLMRFFTIGAATILTAALFMMLHRLMLEIPPAETATAFADRSAGRTLLEAGFLPRWHFLRKTLRADWFLWALIGAGWLLALMRRRWLLAAMVLALTPVLYYRNAFPYFYVVMLAPAAVLAGWAIEEVRALAQRGETLRGRDWMPGVFGFLLLLQGGARLPLESGDEQLNQRAVLKAVHEVFPTPVPYIDHSGMIATYRKVNFFMSSWGIEDYRQRGKPFLAKALREHRPPLLLANTPTLRPGDPFAKQLLPEDAELLQRFYQPYWGPILIAGASVELDSPDPRKLALPFPGAYRLSTEEPVFIDGQLRQAGEVIAVADATLLVSRRQDSNGRAVTVKLLWAEAGPVPAEPPVFEALYYML